MVIKFFENLLRNGTDKLVHFSVSLLSTIIFLLIAHIVIKVIIHLVNRALNKSNLAPGVKTFTRSLINITLIIVVIITAIGMLGVKTTSITALLASAGVAFGMALSGNLQNLAGGIIILVTKPFGVGSVINAQNVEGIVDQILIFHTIIKTYDNQVVYIPNGALSGGVIRNITTEPIRRNEWNISVEYGSDLKKAREIIHNLLASDSRILKEPAPEVVLKELANNGLIFRIRAWSETAEIWKVYFALNDRIYEEFTNSNIGFPFTQIQIHQKKA